MDGGGDGVAPTIIHLIIIHPHIIHLILTDIRSGLRRRFMFSARISNPLPRHRATGITAVTLRVIILPSRNVLKGGSRLFPSHRTNRFLIPAKMRRLFALLALWTMYSATSGRGRHGHPASGVSLIWALKQPCFKPGYSYRKNCSDSASSP